MNVNPYSSKLLENAVNELASLPGIGKKTALRLALHLLHEDMENVETFGQAIIQMRRNIRFCKVCHNISDKETCEICSNPKREQNVICVVEDVRDVMAIESTNQFKGLYHVLNGIISPIDGISPEDLTIGSLVEKVASGKTTEIILALPATIEGDTTNFYIYKKLRPYKVLITTISRGVAIGDELEYTDEITLGRSILNRTLYQGS
ncbi:MAG: recombination mediator RecR [Bacteroidales bacterium]